MAQPAGCGVRSGGRGGCEGSGARGAGCGVCGARRGEKGEE